MDRQPDEPRQSDHDRFYSDDPPTPAELRAFRRMLADDARHAQEREEFRAMLVTYRLAGTLRRVLWIVGAWIVGAMITGLGILTALRELGWWPRGGP